MPEQQASLDGKVALVTGAGRGIGKAIAQLLLQHGANVALHYHVTRDGAEELAQLAESRGRRALIVQADMGRKSEIDRMYEQLQDHFGRLDILVNNTAVFSSVPMEQVTEEHWDQVQSVNLKGVFFSCQRGAQLMLANGGGVMLNLASGGGLDPSPGYTTSPAYASSKAGVIMPTKHLAFSLAPKIRVNCICPGMIDSKPEPMPQSARSRFARQTPLERVGVPEDIAAAALYLCSDASSFVTGQLLNVDGGVLMPS